MPSSSSSPPASFRGSLARSYRGFLAATWSTVNLLTLIAFTVALYFGVSPTNDNTEEYYYYNQGNKGGDRGNENDEMEPELAVTSRALVFAAMWTAVLAILLCVFGTVILGWQSPTGTYYACCSNQVHRTTPITLGGFIGALLMFANLTLVCGVFFGEFDVRDYRQNEQDRNRDGEEEQKDKDFEFFAVRRRGTSLAFSILCLFLAVMYGAFAGLVFTFSHNFLGELADEEADEITENKQRGLAPLSSPRLSSKTSASHFVRPHEAYHKHTHSATSLVGYGPPPAPSGSLT